MSPDLTGALARHVAADDQEAADLRQIREFVERHPDPFDRRISEGHLTGSALVVSAAGGRVLLVHHRKLDRWLQPGGHADPGETAGEAVALREAREETGIRSLALHASAPRPLDVDVHDIPARSGEPAHLHLDLRYLVVAPEDASITLSVEESTDLRWFTWEELAGLDLDHGLRRALVKGKKWLDSAFDGGQETAMEMTTDGLHPSLLALWKTCHAVRRELLAILDEVPPARWLRRPRADGWSVAQQMDHLLRSEIGTSKMARRLIRGDFHGLARPGAAPLHDSRLDAYPYGRLAAPAGLEPGEPPLAEAKAQLAANHRRFFEELLRFAGPDPDALASPDPATGVWFTLGGWLRLQALHEAHHIRATRELLPG